MAKHISKSVIEDIAYQLKNSGLWLEKAKLEERPDINYNDPNVLLDDLIEQLAGVLDEHDPTFDRSKFILQTQYRAND